MPASGKLVSEYNAIGVPLVVSALKVVMPVCASPSAENDLVDMASLYETSDLAPSPIAVEPSLDAKVPVPLPKPPNAWQTAQ